MPDNNKSEAMERIYANNLGGIFMYSLDECILVTNNDRAKEKWQTCVREAILLDSYEAVLEKARDLVHTNHKLLTHPQCSSLKPNQTPYKTILLYGGKEKSTAEDICLIEGAIEAFKKWNAVKRAPVYHEKIANDYKTIDLSMIENVIPRL